MIQMGLGHQFIKITQAGLILCEDNQVVRGPPSTTAPFFSCEHPVNLRSPFNVLFPEHGNQGDQNQAAGFRIVKGPVVLERRQAQRIGHRIQFVVGQLGTQILSQHKGIEVQRVKPAAGTGAVFPDETGVKRRIVGAQRQVSRPIQKRIHRLCRIGRTLQQLVGDSGKGHGFCAERVPWLGKGRKLVHHFPALDTYRADLNDGVGLCVQAGGLQVKGHELSIQRHIPWAVDRRELVHVVLVVRLHAVQHLDLLAPTGGVISVRKGLNHPVVGDGDGGMSPLDSLLHDLFCVAKRVHLRHFGM